MEILVDSAGQANDHYSFKNFKLLLKIQSFLSSRTLTEMVTITPYNTIQEDDTYCFHLTFNLQHELFETSHLNKQNLLTTHGGSFLNILEFLYMSWFFGVYDTLSYLLEMNTINSVILTFVLSKGIVWHEPCYNSLIAFYSTSMKILMILLELVKLKHYYHIRHMDKYDKGISLLRMIKAYVVWNAYYRDGGHWLVSPPQQIISFST
mgnify:CR=1 FL=1